MPITAGHLGAGIHAAGLSAGISSAAAAGFVGENINTKANQSLKLKITWLLLLTIFLDKQFI